MHALRGNRVPLAIRFDPNSKSVVRALSSGGERDKKRDRRNALSYKIHPRPAHTCVSHGWVVVEWDASPGWQHEDSHGKRRLLSKVDVPNLPRQCRRRSDVLVGVGDHPQRRRGKHRHRLPQPIFIRNLAVGRRDVMATAGNYAHQTKPLQHAIDGEAKKKGDLGARRVREVPH